MTQKKYNTQKYQFVRVKAMLENVKTFARDELDLALINLALVDSNTLVTLFLFSNIHVRMNKRKEIKF